jgi:hypothetical protein
MANLFATEGPLPEPEPAPPRRVSAWDDEADSAPDPALAPTPVLEAPTIAVPKLPIPKLSDERRRRRDSPLILSLA